ncbi:MAG: hypothetical protein EA393_00910 [Bacteroidetes bacterium]|nr:MAG: hypothetical protein EA393_00910 [Bacteroidota bacterium]
MVNVFIIAKLFLKGMMELHVCYFGFAELVNSVHWCLTSLSSPAGAGSVVFNLQTYSFHNEAIYINKYTEKRPINLKRLFSEPITPILFLCNPILELKTTK